MAANTEYYKAGAKACIDGEHGATNPHPPESAQAAMWDAGYLDRQKLHAYRDANLSRRGAMRNLNRVGPVRASDNP
ncbi:hypothetical protein [Rhizobium binxianense]